MHSLIMPPVYLILPFICTLHLGKDSAGLIPDQVGFTVDQTSQA